MNIEELLTHSKKKYIAKIGNSFLVLPMSKDAPKSTRGQELERLFEGFADEMTKCLKDTPNIVSYSAMESQVKPKLVGAFRIEGANVVEIGKDGILEDKEKVNGIAPDFLLRHIKFQALWPRKNQDVPPWHSGQVVETFHILYDAAIFLAFGDSFAGDRSYAWQFGLEAMKIIKSCFERSTLWKVVATGPILLHPALYFVFLNPELDLTFPATEAKDGDLYIFFPYQDDATCAFVVERFFNSIARDIKEHYRNQILRGEIIKTQLKFRHQFETLCAFHRDAVRPNPWNPVAAKKRHSHIRQLRDGIREAYEVYVRLMDMQASIVQRRGRYRARLAQNQFLKPIAKYLDEQLSDVGQTDFSPILQGLRFLEEETRMVSTVRSNLQAALIGALIGAITYAIVSVFLG
jgi:hypothetical protein